MFLSGETIKVGTHQSKNQYKINGINTTGLMHWYITVTRMNGLTEIISTWYLLHYKSFCSFLLPLIYCVLLPLFCTSDVCSYVFQMDSPDSTLVQHLLTSQWAAWQPGLFYLLHFQPWLDWNSWRSLRQARTISRTIRVFHDNITFHTLHQTCSGDSRNDPSPKSEMMHETNSS